MFPCPWVPLIDLAAQHRGLRSELLPALERVLDSGAYILGPELEGFEQELSRALDSRHVLGVSSGTDALLMALLAAEIGTGDEVITTALSFFATTEAILRVGARPVFVDVDPETACLDAHQVESARSARTRAVLPVHLFGTPASPEHLRSFCSAHHLWLIEDAAQGLGGCLRGQPLGTFGDFGCFSFFPSKPVGALGDAGALVVADPRQLSRCHALRTHGAPRRGEHQLLGGNFRMDALQAAMLRIKLCRLQAWRAARLERAGIYDAALGQVPGLALVAQAYRQDSALAHYVVRVRDGRRDALQRWLTERGVASAVYYTIPIHRQPLLADLCLASVPLPETDRCAAELLAIPLYPELQADQQEQVIGAVLSFFAQR